MESSQIVGYVLAVFVGIVMGLIGSGGSILSVPILAYVMGIEPVLATAYSLFAVGSTALFGGVQKANQKLVDFKKVFLFGIPTVISVFITRKYIVPSLPEVIFDTELFTLHKSVLIMLVFAVVMILAAIRMIKPIDENTIKQDGKLNYGSIFLQGLTIGLVAGFVGAGGGFLIIPALLFLVKTPMKTAVGTSLFIVAIQSLIGFLGDLSTNQVIDWKLLLIFTFCSIIGVIIGNIFSKKVTATKLKTGFGYFVLAMGIYIIIKEVFLK
ncbi:sulfite exporter TauE/SafE family protein [Flavobacterium capsici]|uniref:Probable membrane transporter protein n=1 Tax=Flavobacterium capsici TaxID=3075618 RepID=A0AA96F4X2_9FLAO|nr:MULTISPECIES: sulfite exporter TauE/SafE family protein [unclassified Flavobacterium]WNM18729.1 sulfite exporter TauE/SafE family protein [Flavobacterium sp. PMR2A8]WNM22780.1 sulfite exporter TauE/SafE family protein [Flavobacterium sp. PMTSA4]